jgi:hypothetical protein
MVGFSLLPFFFFEFLLILAQQYLGVRQLWQYLLRVPNTTMSVSDNGELYSNLESGTLQTSYLRRSV